MFTNLKPYPEYTDSGQPWFGPIPASWHARGARILFAEVKSPGHEDADMLSVTIGRGVIRQSDLLAGSPKKDSSNLDKSKYKLVEPGDIAYNKMRAWQGAVGLSQHRGIVSPAYIVIRPRQGSGAYFHHLLRTPGFAKEAERWSYGITSDQWSLRPEHFKMIYFPFPPDAEQEAIVKYLGQANARIDRAIAAKRKLIALLEEQKQVIINQTVTRGLDPTVSLKDSGIPRFGQIPDHWQVSRLGWLISLQTGYPFESLGYTTDENAIRLLRGVNVGTGQLQWGDVVRWPSEGRALENFALEVGDIVLGMDRPVISGGIRVTRVGVDDVPSLLVQRVARVRPAEGLLADYLMHLMSGRAFADYLRPIFTGISVPHLSPHQISHFEIPVPPVAEQRRIVEMLVDATAGVRETRAKVNREIELLREFRTRLTAEVVTGQLDVRDAASRLPELNPADLVSDPGPDEDDLEADLAESLEEVDA